VRQQRGSALIIALFLIVVVALLAAFGVTVGGSQRQSTTVSMMADRALAAARSGTEWAGYRALVNNSCVANRVLALNEGALRGFRVIVACTSRPHTEAVTYNVYDVTSESQFGTYGSADYVSRKIQARFSNAP
jgi:MSHA biogenesis protein MshP